MKHLLTSILITIVLFSPLSVGAQTVGQNQQILQRFQPNASIQSSGNNRIGGVNFSGVSGSVLACANVGGIITNAIGSLFKKGSGGVGSKLGSMFGKATGQKVPTTDETAQTKLETANKKESCLDAIAYTLAKQALTQVTNKTLNWVNTGFGGNPFYIRDAGSFLRSIEKESFRDYISIAGQTDNQIIGESVSNKLIELFTGRRSPQLDRLPQTAAEATYDAFSKDFTQGGWGGWLDVTVNNQNPLGQFLNITEKLSKDYGEKEDQTNKELDQGNGFLSQKKCVEFAPAPLPDDNYDFNTSADGSLNCLRYETVTPGAVIAAQTQNVTNSGTRQLEAADELNEVLGAFFDSLLNKLFNKGLQTLGRDSGDNFGNSLSGFGGQGSNIVIGSNGQPINGTGSGVVLPYNQPGDLYDTSTFNISNPRHIAAVIKTQKTFLNRALDSQASLQKIVPNLGHLDYCLPGPHPTWATDTESGALSLFTSMRGSGMSNPLSGFFTIDPYDLFDPLKGSTQSFSNKSLVIQNNTFASGFDIAALFSNWLSVFENTITTTFSENALSAAYAGLETTTAAQTFARGFVSDSFAETSQLPQYLQAVVETDSQYASATSDTRSAITELESIRAEVLDIVTAARTRHIATKQSQGIAVNMACLNEAYDISNSPITAPAREEADATAELNALESAQASFYTNL